MYLIGNEAAPAACKIPLRISQLIDNPLSCKLCRYVRFVIREKN